MKIHKYQGLGNDYLVIAPQEIPEGLTPGLIRQICDRHYGLGSDGILWGPLPSPAGCDFAMKIYNPDGSPAEKSGNGLRIFSRYLYDQGQVGSGPFTVQTDGGQVTAHVLDNGNRVSVEMGQATFDSRRIPVAGPEREVLDERMVIGGKELRYCAVSMGNPHCVVLDPKVSAEEAKILGPLIETEPRFPNRTNVQFLQVLDRQNLQIEIWERGAGYTLASGSSSCAAAAAAHRLGLCERQVTMHMPGGVLDLVIGENYAITMTGPVEKAYQGEIIF